MGEIFDCLLIKLKTVLFVGGEGADSEQVCRLLCLKDEWVDFSEDDGRVGTHRAPTLYY